MLYQNDTTLFKTGKIMNWEKIKETCPLAWDKFIKGNEGLNLEGERLGYNYTDGVHSVVMFGAYNIRNLYDFFDDVYISINIFKIIGMVIYNIINQAMVK